MFMSIPNELYNIKFEDYKESLHMLYLVDDRFRLMCEDYCSNKLKTDSFQRKFEKCFQKKLKHETLSKELEEEILIYLIRKGSSVH